MKSLTAFINEQRTDEVFVAGLITSASLLVLFLIAIFELNLGLKHAYGGAEGDSYNWWNCVKENGLLTGTITWILGKFDDLSDYLSDVRTDRRYKKLMAKLENDPQVIEFVKMPKTKRRLKDIKDIIVKYNKGGEYDNLAKYAWEKLRDYDNTADKVEQEIEKELA